MGDLFGGGDSPDVTMAETLRPLQTQFLDLLTQQLINQFAGGQLRGVTPYAGIRPEEVPFGPLQQQAFGLAGGLAPGIRTGLDIFGRTMAGFDPTIAPRLLGTAEQALIRGLEFDPTQNILSALEPGRRLALRTFEEDITPFLAERYGATAGASGAFNRAITQAGANLALGLGAQAAPFLGQAALQQPGIQFAGAGLGGQLAGIPGQIAGQGLQFGGMGADLISQLANIGAIQQQFPRGVAAAEQQRFMEAQPYYNPYLARFGPLALGTQAVTPVIQPAGPGLGAALLPALGSFLGTETGAGAFKTGLGGLLSELRGLFG